MNRFFISLLATLALMGGLLSGCQNSGSSGSGRMESNLKTPETDPEKFKKGVEDLMAKEKAAKGK